MVVPAHNEEASIGRALQAMTDGLEPGEAEIVVVCNGCDDDTARVARAAYPQAIVVELAAAGKAAAMNAGDEMVSAFPRFYVDADVEIDADALRTVSNVMSREQVGYASVAAEFVTEGRPWVVRSFYLVWQQLAELRGHLHGSGVFALSHSGRERFEKFPPLTADDQFVLQLFDYHERRSVTSVRSRVQTPKKVSGLVSIRRRVYRGNQELVRFGMEGFGRPPERIRALLKTASKPSMASHLAAYLAINTIAKTANRLNRHDGGWERDDSTRLPVGASPATASRIGYVVSRYPSLSHTFILREVMAGRRAGAEIDTFSVTRTPQTEILSAADEAAAASTWNIRPAGLVSIVRPHLSYLLRSPGGWASVLREAIGRRPGGLKTAVYQVFYFAEGMILWAECRRRGIRHLHAHFTNVAADVAWIATDLGRRIDPGNEWSWSMSVHGPTEFYDVHRCNLARKIEAADLVVCISDFARSQLMGLSSPDQWGKMAVAHTGADLAKYVPRLSYSSSGGPLNILSVGRFDAVKGQAILIEAMAALAGLGVDARLVIVGDGPIRHDLEQKIAQLGVSDTVSMPGSVGQDELPSYFAAADVFCMASFAEGIPVVLMEAMATGLPVVATWIAGIPELVEDGSTGLLVPPGRADLLAAALVSLSEDPELRSRLGIAGRAKIEQDFDAQRCGAEVAALLSTMRGSRAPTA